MKSNIQERNQCKDAQLPAGLAIVGMSQAIFLDVLNTHQGKDFIVTDIKGELAALTSEQKILV